MVSMNKAEEGAVGTALLHLFTLFSSLMLNY